MSRPYRSDLSGRDLQRTIIHQRVALLGRKEFTGEACGMYHSILPCQCLLQCASGLHPCMSPDGHPGPMSGLGEPANGLEIELSIQLETHRTGLSGNLDDGVGIIVEG